MNALLVKSAIFKAAWIWNYLQQIVKKWQGELIGVSCLIVKITCKDLLPSQSTFHLENNFVHGLNKQWSEEKKGFVYY